MTAAEMKQEISSMSFCQKTIATGAIVDLIIDRVADGGVVDFRTMESLVADTVRLTKVHRSRIDRDTERVSA